MPRLVFLEVMLLNYFMKVYLCTQKCGPQLRRMPVIAKGGENGWKISQTGYAAIPAGAYENEKLAAP